MNRSDLLFLEHIFKKSVAQIGFHVLVVNQTVNGFFKSDYEHIKVVNTRDFGLSKSRNIALSQASKKLFWFLDDDVEIMPNAVQDIVEAFNKNDKCGLKIFRIVNQRKRPFRLYNDSRVVALKPVHLRGLCSIEMVINRVEVTKYGIKFREDLGLGTNLPVGEEFVFATQLLKEGVTITFETAVVAIHDENHTGLAVMSAQVLAARGFIHALLYPKFKYLFHLKYMLFLVRHGHLKSYKQWKSTYTHLTSRVP